MLYELDHCGARYFDQGENMLLPYPICASAGVHSENDRRRSSDMEGLGLMINLYFKMLKYFQWLFFMLVVFQAPALLVFLSGDAFYSSKDMPYEHWLAMLSLGNLNDHQKVVCSERSLLSPSGDKKAEVKFACGDEGYVVRELKSFGLTTDG